MQNSSASRNAAKSLLSFTLPLILSGLFQQMFNWVDAFIVGNVEGEIALAGIGATTSVYNLFVTVITGFASGLSVLSARQYGMGEEKNLAKTLSCHTVLLGTVFLLLSLAGILFTDKLLLILDTPETIFSSAEEYLKILFTGIPFLAVYNTYSAILRGMGNSKAPFLSVLVSSGVNVGLDRVFVAGLGYGAAGAAIATVIAQIAMTLFVIGYTFQTYPGMGFSFSKASLNIKLYKNGAWFGLPPAIQSGISSVGNIFLQRFMNQFGEQTVAAITTAYRVDTVLFLPIINFGSGIATLTAQNIGSGEGERAKKVFQTGTLLMGLLSISLTFLVLFLGEHLMALFGLTRKSVIIGKDFFHCIAGFYFVYGFSMALRGYLEGTGDMLFSGIAGILSLMVRILCSYLFQPVFGNMVVAYGEAFSWLFLLVIFLLRYGYKTRLSRTGTKI